MSAAAAVAAMPAVTEGVGFEPVLTGAVLTGPAARLAGLLEPGFLAEAGWDPVARVLSPPAEHPLLGRTLCRVSGCAMTSYGGVTGGVCSRCFTRLGGQGLTAEQIASSPGLPPAPARPGGCAVTGCERMSPTSRSVLCAPHRRLLAGTPGTSVERFRTDPRVRPLPPLGPCQVPACIRWSEDDGHRGYCPAHYERWRAVLKTDPGTDPGHWRLRQSAVAEGGQVSLRGLPPLVVTEVLFGLQQRVRGGAKIKEVTLRSVCDTLRREQVPAVAACPPECLPGRPPREALAAIVRDVRRALADPGSERAGDVWDLALFGHRGRLSFTGISQPWLAEAAKVWAGEELPRHRGSGAGNSVRPKINALARLSESLRAREDHGLAPERLGRSDIETFLNRLAYLDSSGVISRDHRNTICRSVRAVFVRDPSARADPARWGGRRAARRRRARAPRYPC